MPIMLEISSSGGGSPSLLLVDDAPATPNEPLRGAVFFLEGDRITDEAMLEDLGKLLEPVEHLRVMQDKFGSGFWVGV